MATLMYAVGTPVQGSNQRQTCVYFRPRTAYDTDYFRVVYGDGCSGTVSERNLLYTYVQICS